MNLVGFNIPPQRTKVFCWGILNSGSKFRAKTSLFFWTINTKSMCSRHLWISCSQHQFLLSSILATPVSTLPQHTHTHTRIHFFRKIASPHYVPWHSDRSSNHSVIGIGHCEWSQWLSLWHKLAWSDPHSRVYVS